MDEHPKSKQQDDELLVVGLGASAGGLEALESFFDAMPENPGMAFVVIVHLSPDHKSSMAELLQEHTSMPVTQVSKKTRMGSNHIYIIPPGQLLTLEDRDLILSEADKKEKKLTTIDLFFRSLGTARNSYSACIILSGTGSDGSTGLKTIKEYGGIVLCQDPEQANYDGMPRSALQTGLVDFVLSAREMPAKLIEYKDGLKKIKISDLEELPKNEAKVLNKIFGKINTKMGHDFSQYKRSSILRRLERRMRITHTNTLSDYLTYITNNSPEINELFKDLLISVTNFFRDQQAFAELEKTVIPKLFEDKSSEDSIRIWVPGCATGEEAYSLAILLHEYAQTVNKPPDIQIFATDIDRDALDIARKGQYPESIATDISTKRLSRYFTKEGIKFQVKQNIRNLILFAAHDLLKDPPFSKLDLISCRNVLIYLNRDLQSKVFNLFHYALKPGQWLFLGLSDSILEATDLFNSADNKYQIYQKNTVSKSRLRLPRYPLSKESFASKPSRRQQMFSKENTNIENLHHQLLFKEFEPASVIINKNNEVLHSTSDIDRFLKYSGGEPSQNILNMIVPELRKVLSRLLFQAKQGEAPLTSKKVQLNIGDSSTYYKIIVRKIVDPKVPEGLLHIIFMTEPNTRESHPKTLKEVKDVSAEESDIIAALEKELEYTKEQLHITVEEYETSNEELQASNEELQSMNEELRSTTEQLETSKEELQSVNEELKSVNTELENKIDKLNEANSNLKNLMESTDIATLFIDGNNCLQFFTSSATNLFNLIPSDTGRPFKHVTHQLNYDSIQSDIKQVNKNLETIKKVVADNNEHQYIMRVRPYRTINNKIDGVVLTFVDVTSLKKAEQELKEEIERSENLQKQILSNSLAERWELGEYLHDNLGQILATIKIMIYELKNELTGSGDNKISPRLNDIISEIKNLIDLEVDNIRNLSHDIIPIDVEQEGVSHAFNLLMRRSQEVHEIKCILETDGVLDEITNRELSTNLYHITQEAIKNASIHGEAKRIRVDIKKEDDQLYLQIKDDGKGFTPEETNSEGMGLQIMHHRVELLDGTLTIKRLPDSDKFSTSVECTFPIKMISADN
ncbi:CheR family methyltransferase [Fodinibius sp. SL11]|uniref:CheR family methyltransferase n=1 Tax=Fodinibius sp. SL11 TaxID=3425690 RepID=UPI003F882BD5